MATIDERIALLQEKQAQLKEQERKLTAQKKEKEKKARNHRLICIGAEVERFCGEITDMQAWANYVSQYANAIKNTQRQTVSASVSDAGSENDHQAIAEPNVNTYD